MDSIRLVLKRKGKSAPEEQELVMRHGDLSLLRLIEVLLQALPQLLLQTYIYMTLDYADVYAGLFSLRVSAPCLLHGDSSCLQAFCAYGFTINIRGLGFGPV